MAFDAMRYVRNSSADQYVREIDLPGMAREGAGPEFVETMVSARAAMLRPQFQRLRMGASMGVNNRLGVHTDTGQRVKAADAAELQIGGSFADVVMGAERENEAIRRQAEQAYMGHLSFMDNLRMQGAIAQEQIAQMEQDRKFGLGDALGLAAMAIPTG